MSELRAWQHIYANVEEDESPRKLGGFQTLFYSRSGLTEDEVERIESRLPYYPSESAPVKRVFFASPTGKIVVGQIVPIPEPDRLGRGGRYLAHNLVFAPREFARHAASPFQVFARFPFATTVAEALARGDRQSGDIPPASVSVSPEDEGVEAARLWPIGELKKLVQLALRADILAREKLTVAFMGDPAQIESALAAALLAVPAPLLPRCSFDTYFYRCNPVSLYCWAVGAPDRVTPKYLVVEAGDRLVAADIPAAPETPYEVWLLETLSDRTLGLIARHKNAAFALCQWLTGRPCEPDLLDAAPPELVESVFQVHAKAVKERLHARLDLQLARPLAERILPRVQRETQPAALLAGLRNGFEMPVLLEQLHAAYQAEGFRAPSRGELNALAELLKRAGHPRLRLLCTCWAGGREALRDELRRLTEDQYREFVRTALRYRFLDPLSLILQGRGGAFVSEYLAADVLRYDSLAALVAALLDVHESAAVEQLAPHVAGRRPDEIRQLSKLIGSRPNIPQSFRRAVVEAAAKLPPRKGLSGFIRSLFDRDRDKPGGRPHP